MTKAISVAAYLTDSIGNTTAMPLQSLLYYSQGCYLALHGDPLFDDPIEAWTNGPIVRRVFKRYRNGSTDPSRRLRITNRPVTKDKLSAQKKQIVSFVVEVLREFGPDELTESARQETPWRIARERIPGAVLSRRVIRLDDMKPYFERVCLAQAVEPSRDELSPAAFKLCMEFAHRRAFTPPVVAAEHAEEWFAMLDAPPRDLPGLRALLTEARERTKGRSKDSST